MEIEPGRLRARVLESALEVGPRILEEPELELNTADS